MRLTVKKVDHPRLDFASANSYQATHHALRIVPLERHPGLRASEGAAFEYQETISQLEKTLAIIHHVESLCLTVKTQNTGILTFVNTISGQGAACRDLLSKFAEKVERYDSNLGPQAREGFCRGIWTKSEWALHFSKELESIKKVISAKVDSINHLFQLLEM